MCGRQHTVAGAAYHRPREGTAGVPRNPLRNPRLPSRVLELTIHEVDGGSWSRTVNVRVSVIVIV